MKYKLKKILLSNWLLCSLLTLLIISGMLLEFYPMQFLEYKAYDTMAALRRRNDTSPVVIVAIDDRSLADIGSWPWPRSYIAKAVGHLAARKPKVMGLDLMFTGPEINPGLAELRQVRTALSTDPFLKRRKSRYKIEEMLSTVETAIDGDAALVSAVNYAVNAVLPLKFVEPAAGIDGTEANRNDWLLRHSIEIGSRRWATAGTAPGLPTGSQGPHGSAAVIPTYEELARKASALGHTNVIVDRDGIVREIPLLLRYADRHFPAFALQAAAKYLNGSLEDIRPSDGGLALKHLDIPTDGDYRMLVDFRGDGAGFRRVSFSDVYNDAVEAEAIQGKIVLMGITAPWLTNRYGTATGHGGTEVEITANAVENILNRSHFSRPAWAFVLELLVVVYFGLFLVFVIPRVRPRDGGLILGIFLVTWICFSVVLFMVFGYWLRILAPVFLTVLGFSVAGFNRFALEKQRETIELNKLLGLSFQGKGMLDMAFDKFCKCPVDNDAVRELLYNLGQDFERKRMFNKALTVYTHMTKAGRYRDIWQRIENLKRMGEAPTPRSIKSNGSIILDDATTKPTLGRYEILKELGQGAMGTVYLGRDPKINREVAIKTMSYANVEADKLEEVKDRFLREAEAAGRLSHPNIVTIFDVGEEHDMAYMAMELLKGKPLSEYCHASHLLPVKKVLGICALVADALDYAHTNGVVHRDIKPDNIMLMEDGQVKVADFGIARVMSTSQTQTGVILGTPNYMSPEQVEGLHVDGRSDLFSLGVVMYEMLTGQKPFTGDNMAHLMYNIANASFTPMTKVSQHVPTCCNGIVKKLLTREADKRIASAADVARKIRKCRESLE